MIGTNCRKLFKKWKLTEREAFFGTTIIYEIQGIIRVERYFWEKECKKDKIHNMLRYLFWEYEYEEWMILTARQISYLLWCDHTTVDNIIARCKQRLRDYWHLDYFY